MTNKCRHQFFEVTKISSYAEIDVEKELKRRHVLTTFNSYYTLPDKSGIKVTCALCGQTKNIWSNGEIEIVKEGGGEVNVKRNSKVSKKTSGTLRRGRPVASEKKSIRQKRGHVQLKRNNKSVKQNKRKTKSVSKR